MDFDGQETNLPSGSSQPEQAAVYLVNRSVILLIQTTFLLGIPLLTSFFIPWLKMWRLLSVLFVLTALALNPVYPDRIALDGRQVRIKLLLWPRWRTIAAEQMQLSRDDRGLWLYVRGRRRYRITMERLSVRLYRQLQAQLALYEKERRNEKEQRKQ